MEYVCIIGTYNHEYFSIFKITKSLNANYNLTYKLGLNNTTGTTSVVETSTPSVGLEIIPWFVLFIVLFLVREVGVERVKYYLGFCVVFLRLFIFCCWSFFTDVLPVSFSDLLL